MSLGNRLLGSKVVDRDGQPLLVYHGTRRKFDAFVPMKPMAAFGNPVGIYFTDCLREAEEFAQDVDGATDEHSRVISAHLLIRDDTEGLIRRRRDGTTEFIVFKPESVLIVSNTMVQSTARFVLGDRPERP